MLEPAPRPRQCNTAKGHYQAETIGNRLDGAATKAAETGTPGFLCEKPVTVIELGWGKELLESSGGYRDRPPPWELFGCLDYQANARRDGSLSGLEQSKMVGRPVSAVYHCILAE